MKVNVNNTEKIEKALGIGNGKARARTVGIEEVNYMITQAEKYFEENDTPKKLQAGVIVENIVNVCNSYWGKAEFTKALLEKGSKDWFLTACHRDDCKHTAGGDDDVILNKTRALLDYERGCISETEYL